MPDPVELAERDQRTPSTLARVFGTGDMAAMIEATKSNVNAAIEFAEEREFVTRYPVQRNGRTVGERLWFHHPTWQLLGMSFGVTAYTEGEPSEIKPGVWQAAAVAASVETGQVIGRSVGMASKTEPGKGKMSEHTLAAQAQARAQRNALRSCLGAALIAAGFEVADPEGPATKEQLAVLHILEREIGWSADEAHADAGVTSYTKLTRDQASDVIERWTAIRDELRGGGAATPPTSDHAGATDPAPEQSAALGEVAAAEEPSAPDAVLGKAEDGDEGSSPASAEAWSRVPKDMSVSAAIKLATKLRAAERIPGPVPKTKGGFTGEQLARVSAAWRDGERG
jgi:hypothetical protein